MEIADRILDDYKADLRRQAEILPQDQRTELLAGIDEHIAAARQAGQIGDAESARTLTERLGSPGDLVRETAISGSGAILSLERSRPARGFRPLAAFLLLTVGSVVPVLGWAWGLSLVWNSPMWDRRTKLVATFVVPGGLFGAFLGIRLLADWTEVTCSKTAGGTLSDLDGVPTSVSETPLTCTNSVLPGWIGLAIAIALVVAAIAGPAYVYSKARHHEPRLVAKATL